MSTLRRTIPKLTLFVVALAGLAVPVSATITYVACSTGCGGNTSGTYAAWQTASGAAGLTFSMSPATFASANLASGVYTDPTGTVFTGYSGASIDTLMSVSGGSLVEGNNGSGTGIEIVLPANTYAFGVNYTTFTGSPFSTYAEELGDHNVNASNYNTNVPSPGSVQFFGIISTTPLAEVFIGPITGSSGRLVINDFELGESSPTPELPSVTLIGSGLVLFGVVRRRVHKPRGTVA